VPWNCLVPRLIVVVAGVVSRLNVKVLLVASGLQGSALWTIGAASGAEGPAPPEECVGGWGPNPLPLKRAALPIGIVGMLSSLVSMARGVPNGTVFLFEPQFLHDHILPVRVYLLCNSLLSVSSVFVGSSVGVPVCKWGNGVIVKGFPK
jgi:hypothetical protein